MDAWLRFLPLHDQRLLVYAVIAWTLVLGATVALYVWVASRQVRPRPMPQGPPSRPTSPAFKRKRHSKSFSDMQALEKEMMAENAVMDRQDWSAMPLSLQKKCGPEQCTLIYETLSKAFSFLRSEYIDTLAHDLKIHKHRSGDVIFERGKHDGSIIMVAAGEAQLTIHDGDEKRFTKTLTRGDTATSSLSLLAAIVADLDDVSEFLREEVVDKVIGDLSAVCTKDDTVLFEIPTSAVREVLDQYPDSFYRLAQAALSQVEKITARALVDHFGLASSIFTPRSLIDLSDYTRREGDADIAQLIKLVSQPLNAADSKFEAALLECSTLITCEEEKILSKRDVAGSVYFVINGSARIEIRQSSQYVKVANVEAGGEIGVASSFIEHHHPSRIVCKPSTTLLSIPQQTFASFLQSRQVAASCVQHLLRQYSPLVCTADSAFDSVHLHGGESLFDRGDLCDSVFTVVSGRLRAIQVHIQHGKQVETSNELGRGATLGAMDMLAAGRSNSSVFAIRDSQISEMPRCVFDYVVHRQPTVLIHFTKSVAERLPRHGLDKPTNDRGSRSAYNFLLSLGEAPGDEDAKASSEMLPVSTIAVISLTKMAAISTFCSHLHSALKSIGTAGVVSSKKASEVLGDQWLVNSRLGRANLSAWLGDMESSHQLVVYEADPQLTLWTQLCIRQADHILLLCSDSEPPQSFLTDIVPILESAWNRKSIAINVVRIREKDWTLTAVENAKAAAASQSSRRNALKRRLRLWKNSPMLPRFLLPMEKYEWITAFHNVQTPFQDHHPDFLRLSRRITGRSVGLVLGGGGARGLAHIGVLRALEECGVHVDVVGGTSIGACIGAAYALHPHHLNLVQAKIETLSISLSSVMEKLRDLTLPIASFFNGSRFNRGIYDLFFDLSIEDLVLNYFCVSTDIAKSRMCVHHSGPVWKYVRASMSLQGYFPPISEGGSLLLDGGYMNNLPADVMKEERGIKYVLAVDVGSEPRREYYGYGTALSGWWLLWNKLNPFSKTVIVPSMGDVSAALAYVSSEQHKERMKAECIDLYLRPPVNDYGTLQFDKKDEIIQVGYEYALPRVKAWASRVLSVEPEADIVEPDAKITKLDDPSVTEEVLSDLDTRKSEESVSTMASEMM
ncbi:hypothetical protein Poli38472_012844 [Pythium oligandrum]|uniref:Patatin n=1 Tax=Pythium oligandrum TaxID=41045 RepID=A0A8K1CIT8_PYTOL|nr:hypothetical protein Poli38472_012844 [Pythium oligandrum]|eukprot:TMW64222.1 hypothetical protein Poli38472_012844 [Pythium oligandrum]